MDFPELREFSGDFALISERARRFLLMPEPSWVRRRVDTFEFTSVERVRRRISLDFLLDEPPGTIVPVPVATLPKNPLKRLDSTAEDGSIVPALSLPQNSLLVSTGLVAALVDEMTATGVGIPRVVLQQLLASCRIVPMLQPPEANAYLRDLRVQTGPLADGLPRFFRLLESFVNNFVLHVAVTSNSSSRRVIKIAFDLTGDVPGRRMPDDPPVPWVRVGFDLSDIGRAESHHVEVVAPRDMFVTRAEFGNSPDGTAEPWLGPPDVLPSGRVHFLVESNDDETPHGSRSTSEFYVELTPLPSVMHDAAVAITGASACLALVALLAGMALNVRPDTQGSLSLIVGALTIGAAIVARPNAHPLVGDSIREPRRLVLTSLGAGAVAAASLAVRFPWHLAVEVIWLAIFVLTTMSFVAACNCRYEVHDQLVSRCVRPASSWRDMLERRRAWNAQRKAAHRRELSERRRSRRLPPR